MPSGRKSGFPLDCPKYQSIVDAFDYDKRKYPLLEKADALEFEQLPGEMLFIPTGWFHQVSATHKKYHCLPLVFLYI